MREPRTAPELPPPLAEQMPEVGFLSLPENLDPGARRVEVLQTHHAWVFLTDRYVFKLKKPVVDDRLDYRTVEQRRVGCERELTLNRRLTKSVYLDVLALQQAPDGRFSLSTTATTSVVDWVLKMRRLPDAQMLDARILANDVTTDQIGRIVERLVGFYRTRQPARLPEPTYVGRLRDRLESQFGEAAGLLDPSDADVLAARVVPPLSDWLAANQASLERRHASGFVRDLHGDLRPEHVCVNERVEIIDCLEFDADLRCLDCAEEVAFLGLECARLGAADVEMDVRLAYRRRMPDDSAAMPLFDFYAAMRAINRIMLSARRLAEDSEPLRWHNEVCRYLELALLYGARLRP